MAQQFIIPSVFEAIDRMSPAMAVMTRNVNAFGNQAEVAVARGERAFRKMMAPLNKISNSFNNVMGGLGAPVGIAALGYAVKSTSDIFIDFEAANSNVAAGLDMTTKQIRPLTDDAKRLGASTKFAAQQVSELQFEYAKLGFAPEQILKMTESTLSLAAATNFELGPSATTVGAALRAYGLEADQTARVTDVLAASASKTALDMMDFFQNLSTFAPVARAFNFSMEDSIALFGKIRDAGFDASSAATALRNIFLNLADGNGKLAKALGKPAANLQELLKGMITLRDAGVDLATMLEITDKRSVAAFATLLNGAESVGTLADELHRADGFAKKMAATQMDNVKGSLTILKSAWEGWVLSVEDGTGNIAKNIRTVASVFTDVLHIWSGSAKANAELNTTELHIRHMSESVMFWGNVALRAVEAVLVFKAALIAGRIAMTAITVATTVLNAVQNAFFLVDMIRYTAVTKGLTNATAAYQIVMQSLNGTMLLNPAFLLAAGFVAVAGALYLAHERSQELLEDYLKMIELDTTKTLDKETESVKKLVAEYWHLGQSIKEATVNAIRFEKLSIDLERSKLNVKIQETKNQVAKDNQNMGGTIMFMQRFGINAGGRSAAADSLLAQQTRAKELAVRSRGVAEFSQSQINNGTINRSDLGTTFNQPDKKNEGSGYWANAMKQTEAANNFRFYNNRPSEKSEMTITVKNDSDLPVALGSGSRTLDVQPKSKSTTVLDKK